MRILCVTVLGSALLALPIYAQGFLGVELSPRAVSVGGAFVGLADDAAAALWNPAGLSTLTGFGVLGRLAMPTSAASSEIWGAALSARLWAVGSALWYGSQTTKTPHREEHSLIVIALGAGVREHISAGIALKFFDQSTGIDLGLMARFGWVQGGLTIADIGIAETLVRMGATLRLFEGRVRLLGAVDLARQEELRAIRVGIELQPFEGLALRAGWDGRTLTWGGGLGIFHVLQSDFTWRADGWAVSTEIAFGRRYNSHPGIE
jgi:hypothetical protein